MKFRITQTVNNTAENNIVIAYTENIYNKIKSLI